MAIWNRESEHFYTVHCVHYANNNNNKKNPSTISILLIDSYHGVRIHDAKVVDDLVVTVTNPWWCPIL